jgi:flavodoxin
MSKTNRIAVFSQTGNTRKVAEAINGEFEKRGWDTRILSIPDADPAETAGAAVIGVGTPVMYMEVPPVVKKWLQRMPAGEGRPSYVFTT